MTKRSKKESPAGMRAKLSGDFIENLESDWREHGQGVIESLRVSRPEVYARLVADLVPKQVEVATGSEFETMGAAELEAFVVESFAGNIAQGERIMKRARELAAKLAKEVVPPTFQERFPNVKPRPMAHAPNGKAQQVDADPIVTIIADEVTP
jgi:hypothetical protein